MYLSYRRPALNCCDWLTCTLDNEGVTVTESDVEEPPPDEELEAPPQPAMKTEAAIAK
jgi:hypothetical protein